MAKRSVPVPVWNSIKGSWEPIDFRNGQRVVQWPHDFSPQLLPLPEYQEGDRVQFIRDETCARSLRVRLVLFQGDLSYFQQEQGEAMKGPMLDADDIIYIVSARGYDHRIKAPQILRRFVSLERISRILSPQE